MLTVKRHEAMTYPFARKAEEPIWKQLSGRGMSKLSRNATGTRSARRAKTCLKSSEKPVQSYAL